MLRDVFSWIAWGMIALPVAAIGITAIAVLSWALTDGDTRHD